MCILVCVIISAADGLRCVYVGVGVGVGVGTWACMFMRMHVCVF